MKKYYQLTINEMKKTLFFLSIMAIVGMANAQMNVVYNGTNIINNDTVIVNVTSPDDALTFAVVFQNTDTSDFVGYVTADSNDANIYVTGLCAETCVAARESSTFTIFGNSTYSDFHANINVAAGLAMGYSTIVKFSLVSGVTPVVEFWANFVVNNTESLQTARNTSLCIYPNPVTDFMTLSVQNANLSANAQVQVVNALGAVVREMPMTKDNIRINLNDMPAGVYVCRVVDGQSYVTTKKFVVK